MRLTHGSPARGVYNKRVNMKVIFKVYADGKLLATESTQELAKQAVKNFVFLWRHRTRCAFTPISKDKKPKMTIEKTIK